MRHRAPSPNKVAAESSSTNGYLLELAQKERAVWELRERRKELDHQLRVAEQELDLHKRQLSLFRSAELPNSAAPDSEVNSNNTDQTEAITKFAGDGISAVTAIWNDVLSATIGQQTLRKI